jgi:hypothetical protein
VDLELAQIMNRQGQDGLRTQEPSIYFQFLPEDYEDEDIFPTKLSRYMNLTRDPKSSQQIYLYERPTTDQIIRHILIYAYLNDVRVYDIAGDTIIIPPEAIPTAMYNGN